MNIAQKKASMKVAQVHVTHRSVRIASFVCLVGAIILSTQPVVMASPGASSSPDDGEPSANAQSVQDVAESDVTKPEVNESPWSIWIQIALLLTAWLLGMCSQPLVAWADRFLLGPKLEPDFRDDNDCIVHTIAHIEMGVGVGTIDMRCFRVEVVNTKRNLAKKCRAYLTKVERETSDGGFVPTAYCDTLPLNWSYRDESEARTGIDIPYDTRHFVDVVATCPNRDGFVLQTKPEPNCYQELLVPANVYRLTIHVCAEGLEPVLCSFRVEYCGDWNRARAWNAQETAAKPGLSDET